MTEPVAKSNHYGTELIWYRCCLSNRKPKTMKDMEHKDLKELAWEERQRELHEAKMRLLRELDVEDQCVWDLLTEDEIDEINLKLLRGEL